MYTQAVLANLIVSRHDTALTDTLAKLANPGPWLLTLIATGSNLEKTHTLLVAAAQQDVKERTETIDARAKFQGAMAKVMRWYNYAHNWARPMLTTPPPDLGLTEQEIEINSLKFNRIFKSPPSVVQGLGLPKSLEIISGVFEHVSADPSLTKLADSPVTKEALDKATAAKKTLEVEITEDKEALDNLEEARANHIKAQRLYEFAVRGVLTELGKEDDEGRWLLERNAAYRARRAGQKAVVTEEGAKELIEEIGSLPIDVLPAENSAVV